MATLKPGTKNSTSPVLHPQITVSPISVSANLSDYVSVLGSDCISVSGSGFTPNGKVVIKVTARNGTSLQTLSYATTDAAGNMPATVVTPNMSSQPVPAGSYGILVVDQATGSSSNMVSIDLAGSHTVTIQLQEQKSDLVPTG